MKGVTITIISNENGDWMVLYVDEKLEREGYGIYTGDFIDLIKRFKVFKDVKCFEISDENMEKLKFNFPHNLHDVDIIKEFINKRDF